jgi:glycerol-3-phosphate dehydrogenase subunit C
MATITRESLLPLEQYAKSRKDFRARVMAHKQSRKVHLGEHLTLMFEDELTMRYQIQEMLHAERIFEEEGIREELEAYNPLIPDGSNWKATLLIEYPDPEERRKALARLIGIEDRVWVKVAGHSRVHAIADEDLDRETNEKTSSVHFLRFELNPAMKQALHKGAALSIGVDHPNCTVALDPVSDEVRSSLINDLKE